MVRNVHQRLIAAPPERVASLLETLASDDDRVWPHDRWVALRLDGPLAPGSRGGHGPIRYEVARVEPGRLVEFRFPRRSGFRGLHRFEIEPNGDGTVIRHVLEGTIHGRTRVVWPLVIRPLHDALLEDALDKVESGARGAPLRRRRLSLRVRLLRRLGRVVVK
jgi:Polyketide cyclase / dehydrase and lipid transport